MAVQPVGAQSAVQMAYLNQKPTNWKLNVARHSTNTVTPKTKEEIDAKQNDNLLLNLDYVGKQVKALLDLTAGREVKVEKFANKLADDDKRTPTQIQKDEIIVELGNIGDVLKKLNDVENGKLQEDVKPKKQHG